MGYTLITHFTSESIALLEKLLKKAAIHDNNKIPFGRTEDRNAANAALPYHITVCHWGKNEAPLRQIQAIKPVRYTYRIKEVIKMDGREGSHVLCFGAEPDSSFAEIRRQLRCVKGIEIPARVHLTIDVSKDEKRIEVEAERLAAACAQPLIMQVDELRLYHIWKPIELVSRMRP